MIAVYTKHCICSSCLYCFNFLCLAVLEQKCYEKFKCLNTGEKEKWRKKGWIRAAAWFRNTRYICPLSMCVPSFNLLGLTVPEKSVMKKFNVWKLERKKNEEIKRWISSSSLIPVYTVHLPTVQVRTKFHSSMPHSSSEKCDEKC